MTAVVLMTYTWCRWHIELIYRSLKKRTYLCMCEHLLLLFPLRWTSWELLERRSSVHPPVLASIRRSLMLAWPGAWKTRSQTLTSWTSTVTPATLWLITTPQLRRSWNSAGVPQCFSPSLSQSITAESVWCVLYQPWLLSPPNRQSGHAGGRGRHRGDNHRHCPQTEGKMPQHQSKTSSGGKLMSNTIKFVLCRLLIHPWLKRIGMLPCWAACSWMVLVVCRLLVLTQKAPSWLSPRSLTRPIRPSTRWRASGTTSSQRCSTDPWVPAAFLILFVVLTWLAAVWCEISLLFQVIDTWYKSDDEESFNMSRMLIREEGLLCGRVWEKLWGRTPHTWAWSTLTVCSALSQAAALGQPWLRQ